MQDHKAITSSLVTFTRIMTARIRLLMSSYVPLYAITMVLVDNRLIRIIMAGSIIIGCASLLSLIRVASRKIEPRTATPTSVRDLGNEVASYVATYLLPFVTLNEVDLANIVAFFVALTTISIVYVQSDMLGVNPLMYLLKYRVYSVSGIRTTRDGREIDAVVLSREQLLPGCEITLSDLATGVSLAIRSDYQQRKSG